ncbi:MAG: hypothetical protein ABEJ42_03305 [Halobacteriaceae archaeon]
MSRPLHGVHDDPAEGFAVLGGLGVALLAGLLFARQGTTYGCSPGLCLRVFELGPRLEVALAAFGATGLGYAVAVHRRGWRPWGVRGALVLALLVILVGVWFSLMYAPGLVVLLAGADAALLLLAGTRGVLVGTEPAATSRG